MTRRKEKPGKNDFDDREREVLLYTIANICTTMMRDKRGVVADVPRAIGGSLVAPTIDPVHTQRYFGDLKGFGAVDELVMIVTGGVPAHAAATGVDLERALQYENHPSVNQHLPAVWKKLREDVRGQKSLDIQKSAAQETPKLRVSLVAAVVTHRVRIINDLSFDEQSRGKKGGLNGATDPDNVPQCLCAHALPKFFYELVTLRKKFPVERTLMSKADVSDAFRNVRVDPDQAHNFRYDGQDRRVSDASCLPRPNTRIATRLCIRLSY